MYIHLLCPSDIAIKLEQFRASCQLSRDFSLWIFRKIQYAVYNARICSSERQKFPCASLDNEAGHVSVCLVQIGSYAGTAASKICSNDLNEKTLEKFTAKVVSHERTKYKGAMSRFCHSVVLTYDKLSKLNLICLGALVSLP